MKRLLSIFDKTGAWSEPFAKGGWDVIQWDIKLEDYMDINLLKDAEQVLSLFDDVDAVIAAAPCTDFASSGARWFEEKDSSGQTELSIELVRQTMRIVDLYKPTDPEYDGTFFWAIENPVGRFGALTGLENPYYFDPYEFAGHLHMSEDDIDLLNELRFKKGEGISKSDAEFILRTNCYTKKTGLWGEFNRNLKKKPIAPVLGNKWGSPLMRLGGKSDKTKEVRSATPKGFAEAFYQANKDFIYTEPGLQLPMIF